MATETFYNRGWCHIGYDAILSNWVERALPSAQAAVAAKGNARWLRYSGTWFAGVNVLPNTISGAVGDAGALLGAAVDFIHHSLKLSSFCLDKGQISVCYPGYPRPMETEPAEAFWYRRDRDAAHVDGLHPEGPGRRRHLREYHGFILGIPMVRFNAAASPFVVWENSHEIIREAFSTRFRDIEPCLWGNEDVTEAYKNARRKVFADCKRVEVFSKPGEAFIVHRLAVHGTAAWGAAADAGPDGRMICFFRPQIGGPLEWLTMP